MRVICSIFSAVLRTSLVFSFMDPVLTILRVEELTLLLFRVDCDEALYSMLGMGGERLMLEQLLKSEMIPIEVNSFRVCMLIM